jgi:hypothetical protein
MAGEDNLVFVIVDEQDSYGIGQQYASLWPYAEV